ncbi:hypothetical protein MSPP1_001510 [Malassezia sp. CBS 17886]|nr:hypothetical protein MSPP1_001510 [Malassezia sp. CBS 17886]
MPPNVLRSAAKLRVVNGSAREARSALDESAETCWTMQLNPRDNVHSATLKCKLAAPLSVSSLDALHGTFAGGFVPVRVVTLVGLEDAREKDGVRWVELAASFPEDGNRRQSFKDSSRGARTEASPTFADAPAPPLASALALRFEGSTDQFGRIVVYHLAVSSCEA